jgi:hypothetical protein
MGGGGGVSIDDTLNGTKQHRRALSSAHAAVEKPKRHSRRKDRYNNLTS